MTTIQVLLQSGIIKEALAGKPAANFLTRGQELLRRRAMQGAGVGAVGGLAKTLFTDPDPEVVTDPSTGMQYQRPGQSGVGRYLKNIAGGAAIGGTLGAGAGKLQHMGESAKLRDLAQTSASRREGMLARQGRVPAQRIVEHEGRMGAYRTDKAQKALQQQASALGMSVSPTAPATAPAAAPAAAPTPATSIGPKSTEVAQMMQSQGVPAAPWGQATPKTVNMGAEELFLSPQQRETLGAEKNRRAAAGQRAEQQKYQSLGDYAQQATALSNVRHSAGL